MHTIGVNLELRREQSKSKLDNLDNEYILSPE